MFSRWLPIDGDGEAREMEGEARDELTRDEFGTGVEPAVRGGEELHDESRSVRSDDAVSECFKKECSPQGPLSANEIDGLPYAFTRAHK